MIRLISSLPETADEQSVELLRINCLFEIYPDIALFWRQEQSETLISMIDGDMTVYGKGADIPELSRFVEFINPHSVFSDEKTLCGLGLKKALPVKAFRRFGNIPLRTSPDELKSDEIYELLSARGLNMPKPEAFMVDFCRRKNAGQLKAYAKRNCYAAISLSFKSSAVIQGIASRKKGGGSEALCGAVSQNEGKTVLACAREELSDFYIKNGFEYIYNAGYYVRNENGIF